jgi:IS6 family transposase
MDCAVSLKSPICLHTIAKGYGSFQSAWRTLEGIETVNMIRKGRVRWVTKDDLSAQARFVAKLFGIAA